LNAYPTYKDTTLSNLTVGGRAPVQTFIVIASKMLLAQNKRPYLATFCVGDGTARRQKRIAPEPYSEKGSNLQYATYHQKSLCPNFFAVLANDIIYLR
jgi:hypothetical protein